MNARIIQQTDEEYHGDRERVSRSQLVDFLESPRLYLKRHRERDPGWQVKPTVAMDFGTACHRAILVERDATKAFAVIPEDVLNNDGHKKGGAWLRWKRENAGKHHLLSAEGAAWLEMWESIQESVPASRLLMGQYAGAQAEITVHWSFEGIDLRCRIDRAIPGWALGDLKTTKDADERAIVREISSRKLHIQAGMYQWAYEAATGERLPFVFAFVEKAVPYRTVCRQVPQDWIDEGMEQVYDGLRRLQQCADSGVWPRRSDDQIRTVIRPRYDINQPVFEEIES